MFNRGKAIVGFNLPVISAQRQPSENTQISQQSLKQAQWKTWRRGMCSSSQAMEDVGAQ